MNAAVACIVSTQVRDDRRTIVVYARKVGTTELVALRVQRLLGCNGTIRVAHRHRLARRVCDTVTMCGRASCVLFDSHIPVTTFFFQCEKSLFHALRASGSSGRGGKP